MASQAHHERSSSSPPKMMTAFNTIDKPPQPKPKPNNLHSHHQSHHSITPAPLKPLPTIIKPSLNDKQSSNKESSHLRQDSHSSHSNDPFSYARHLKKPLPQVPQNKEIELMVNSNDIYQQDIEPDISDSDSYHNNEKTDENIESKEQNIKQCICSTKCVTEFICNRYMKARCYLFCCNILLIFICFMFAMAQLYDMQLNHEIYIDKHFIVDKNVLFSNDKRAFSDVINYENKSYKTWLWVSIFAVFLLWFIFCFIYFLWICGVDLYNFMYGIYDKYKDDRRILTNNNYCQMIYPYCLCCFKCCKKRKCCMNICRIYSNCLLEYNYICGLDVALYVLALMMKNCVVLIVQILALLHYNGVEIIYIGDNEHLLAENMQFIVIYAVVIGVHQFTIGILWYLYICKHDKCNGRYFNLIIYCINYLFYMFYIINPIILIYTQYNGLYSSLFSNHFSLIQYLGIIIPLIFLSFMTYFGRLYFIRKTHQSWKYKFGSKDYIPNSNGYNDINNNISNEYSNTGLTTTVTVMKTNHSNISNISNNESIDNEDERDDVLTPKNTMTTNSELDKLHNLDLDIFAKKRIIVTFNDECCCKIFCNGKLLLDSKLDFLWLVNRKHSIHKYDHIQTIVINKHRTQQILRRLLIMLYGIICIGFGIFVIIFVLNHFISTINNYNCPSNYDFCQYKIYPFYSNKCECRILRIYDTNHIDINAVNSMLEEFNMLEAIQIDLSISDTNIYSNLSQISLENIHSDHLRIIDFQGVFIHDIDENIINISASIQYLRLYNVQLKQITENILTLSDMQYLDIGYNNIEDSDWICDSDIWNLKLKYLILSNNPIHYGFECIESLLTNSNIFHVNLFGNNIDINSFNQNNELNYNNETTAVYYLQNNPICYRFENSPQNIKDYSSNLYSFLVHSNGCRNDYCTFTNATDLDNLCVPNLWNNNMCDEECNSSVCFYDAYDCKS